MEDRGFTGGLKKHRVKDVSSFTFFQTCPICQALPDDDLVLPEGHQINLDESDDKTPEDARAEERWPLGPSNCWLGSIRKPSRMVKNRVV